MTDRAKQFVDELNDKFSNNLSKIETQFNDGSVPISVSGMADLHRSFTF